MLGEMKNMAMGMETLMGLGVGLVVAGIVVAIGAQILGDVRSDFTVNSVEYNITTEALDGTSNLAERFPTIGLVAGAIVIIGLLVGGFAYFKSQ
jgi:hypothetical protein